MTRHRRDSSTGGQATTVTVVRKLSLATVALAGSIACFTVGHRLVSFTPGDPYCASDEFSCLGHPLVQGWESWMLPMGVGVILFATFCCIVARYELFTSFYFCRYARRMRTSRRSLSHMFLLRLEDVAYMVWIYIGIPAIVVTVVTFLVWLGLGLSS